MRTPEPPEESIWPDRHPVAATCLLTVALYASLRLFSLLHDGPLLFAAAVPGQRVALYAELANSAVAILAVALTVLTILLALPDRPVVQAVQESDTWPLLKALLMLIALLALLTLVAAHLATAIDNATHGKEWLEQLIIATSISGILAMLYAGITFWLVLLKVDEPEDPSLGRGEA